MSGFGDSFKTGGKVVKNVTGYDLCKLLAGSWGTLAVMTEVTLKVMPRPESERTLLLRGLDDADRQQGDDGGARLALRRLRRGASAEFGVPGGDRRACRHRIARAGADLLRLEGITASAAHRAGSLRELLAPFGAAELVEDAASAAFWSAIRDVLPFAADGALGAWPVWRIVCPPASGARARQRWRARPAAT